jgi:hypothetical protein
VSRIASIKITADADAWHEAGFTVADGACRVGQVVLVLQAGSPPGITSWMLAGAPDDSVGSVDGLATIHGEPSLTVPAIHAIGATSIDHLVVVTPDLERTCSAVERMLGLPLRRVRAAGSRDGQPIQQGFFRMGEVVLEVVGGGGVDPAAPARFWGLTFTVADLDAAVSLLGPQRCSPAKEAVQPGRRIASARPAAGLGLPIALMSP